MKQRNNEQTATCVVEEPGIADRFRRNLEKKEKEQGQRNHMVQWALSRNKHQWHMPESPQETQDNASLQRPGLLLQAWEREAAPPSLFSIDHESDQQMHQVRPQKYGQILEMWRIEEADRERQEERTSQEDQDIPLERDAPLDVALE